MSVQSSKTFLKVFGIIDIILGALQVILGVVATAGGGLLASGQVPVEEVETEMPAAIIVVAGVVLLLLGIFSVVEGILSCRAAKDPSKAKPAFVCAIISLVLAAISLISAITSSGSLASPCTSVLINVILVMAANTLRKEGEQG